MTLSSILIIATAYLIGAMPSAYIVGRRHGIDLRHTGDGNLGARNAYFVLGWKPAALVGLLDFGKGAFAAGLATVLSDENHLPYLAALAAALGHDFSIYIRFAGGQGMAAILGSILVLQPRETLLGMAAVALCLLILRNWDLSWAIGIGSMLLWGRHFGRPGWQLLLVAVLFLSIGFKKVVDLPLAHRLKQGRP